MLQLLYLLVIFQLLYIPYSSLVNEDGIINKVSEDYHFINNLTRTLTGNSNGKCLVELCKICSKDYKVCEICEKDCELKGQKCEKQSGNSNEDISLAGIIAMIVSLSVFSIIFCVLCLYFARKYRPKYSGSPNVNMSYTKSEDSIAIASTPEEPNSGTILLNRNLRIPTSPVSQVDIRLSLSKEIFKSLASIKKNEDIKENCAICFSSMALKRLKMLKCNHLVHYKCCRDWLAADNYKCPVCSVEITLLS